jgi:cell division protein FtsB
MTAASAAIRLGEGLRRTSSLVWSRKVRTDDEVRLSHKNPTLDARVAQIEAEVKRLEKSIGNL